MRTRLPDRRGISTPLLIAGLLGAAALVGYLWYTSQRGGDPRAYSMVSPQQDGYQAYQDPYGGYADPADFSQFNPYAQTDGSTPFAPQSGADGARPPMDRERFHQRMLERFDKDGDGKLSEAERQAAHEAMGPMREKLAARRAEMLARFDADHDGQLSESERQAARAAREAAMADPELQRLFEAFRTASLDLKASASAGDPAQLAVKQQALASAHRALEMRKHALLQGR